MTRSDALILREHLTDLKGWIAHWEVDRDCNLIPTKSSLMMAAIHAECALSILARIEAEQKVGA